MSFLVDPKNVSYEQIRQNLIDYVKSRESSASWKDFYEGSTGVVVIELLAAMMTYIQYLSTVNRRESYLAYAQNKSSLTAISETLGWSAYRGHNPRFTVGVQFSTSAAIPRLGIPGVSLGTYRGYGIYPLEHVVLTGAAQMVNVVVGTLKTETIPIPNTSPNVFRFLSPNVSEDISLVMARDSADLNSLISYNDESKIYEWSISKYLNDLINNYSVTLTNAVGSVDVFSVNNMLDSLGDPIQYGGGFNYLQLKYIEFQPLVASLAEFEADAQWSYGGVCTPVPGQTNSTEVAADRSTKDEIRINAPLAHETQLVVRGREDYPKLLQLELDDKYGDCQSTKGHDVTAAEVELAYVLSYNNAARMLTAQEVVTLEEGYFERCRPFGVRPPYIGPIENINTGVGPVYEAAKKYARAKLGDATKYEDEYHGVRLYGLIDITVSKLSMLGVTSSQIESDILAVLTPYYYVLQGSFNLEQIEYDLEQLSWLRTVGIVITNFKLWSESVPDPNRVADAVTTMLDLSNGATMWDYFYEFGSVKIGNESSAADLKYRLRYV